jgi:hypothetical protein
LAYSQISKSSAIFDTRSYTISYFGNNLLKPGLKLESNITLSEKSVIINKSKDNATSIDKSHTKQLLLDANIGFYLHPESHMGVFNYYEVIYRKIKPISGKYSIIGLGPGIYRSFYPETYEVDNSGNVNNVPFGGKTYFAPVLTFGTGTFVKNKFFQSWTFTTNLMFLFDYNSGIVPLLNFEFGLGFDFKKSKAK